MNGFDWLAFGLGGIEVTVDKSRVGVEKVTELVLAKATTARL